MPERTPRSPILRHEVAGTTGPEPLAGVRAEQQAATR